MYTYEVVCVCVCMRKCMCMYMCVCLYVCVCMLCSWMHSYINIKIISNNNASDVTVFITFHCFISSHSPNESWSSVIFLQLMKCGFFLRNLFYSLAWFPFCRPVPLKFPGIFFTWLIQLSQIHTFLLKHFCHYYHHFPIFHSLYVLEIYEYVGRFDIYTSIWISSAMPTYLSLTRTQTHALPISTSICLHNQTPMYLYLCFYLWFHLSLRLPLSLNCYCV